MNSTRDRQAMTLEERIVDLETRIEGLEELLAADTRAVGAAVEAERHRGAQLDKPNKSIN